MASVLKVDALQGIASAGAITVTSEGGSATQSLQQGLCKVFFQTDTLISYTTSGNTNNSFNISSFTDDQTGELHFAFSSNMSQKGFSTLANASDSSIDDTVTTNHDNISTSGSEVIIYDTAKKDQPVSCAIFGDLA